MARPNVPPASCRADGYATHQDPARCRGHARRRLIVNADDFGHSPSINTAVIRAHREGILTTASLMVNEPACAEAVALAKENPELGVGLHIALLHGRSALPSEKIPGLVNARGEFSNNPAGAGMRFFFLRHREDLYYRLNVVTLNVPPLRERGDEIIPLAEQFLIRSAVALKKPVRILGESAQALLCQYRFPGNIRELSNLMERAVLFCQGPTLEAVNFPSDIQSARPSFAEKPAGDLPPSTDSNDPMTVQIAFRVGGRSLADLEDQIIAEVLQRSEGNKSLAAKHLDITRWMLDRRRKN